MVINDFNVVCSIDAPHKTNPPLIIDPDAVLPLPITRQCLKVIPWRNFQSIQKGCRMQLQKLASRHSLDVAKSGNHPTMEQPLCFRT